MEFLYYMLIFWVYTLPFIGIVQSIGSLVRWYKMPDWNTDYGKGLKLYYKIYAAYWLIAVILLILEIPVFKDHNESFWLLFATHIFGVSSLIAIYYWRVVYFLNKKGNPK